MCRLLVSVIWLDHRITVSLCVRRAVRCAVPQGCVTLGLQGRAHGDGIGGVGCWVNQDLGGGGGMAERSLGRQVGRRTWRGIRRWESRGVRGRV